MATSEVQAFVDWASESATAVDPAAGLDEFRDLVAFEKLIAAARVVGFAESQHHLSEFSRMRARLFRFLATRMGFTCFAFECGVVESKAAHDYVLGLHDDADAAFMPIESGFNVWKELQDLVHWMRRYNLDGGTPKLKFYGMDGSRRWVSTSATVAYVCDYLSRVNPSRARRVREELLPLAETISLYNLIGSPVETLRDLTCGIADLVGHLVIEKMRYVEASSYDDFDWAFRAALIGQRIAALLSAVHAEPNRAQSYRWALRDFGMATELKWILDREGPQSRALVGAHNVHLQKVPVGDKPTMGQHLSLTLPDGDLVMIAGTNARSLKPDDPPRPESFQAALAEVKMDAFVLDLRRAADEPLAANWLERPRADRANTDYQTIVPADAWDAVFFTRDVNIDTLSLPKPYERTFITSSVDELDGLDGVYDVIAIGDRHVVLRVLREGERLWTSGLDSDGELFPMPRTELLALSANRYAWPEWAWEVEFDRDAGDTVARGLFLRAPGAIDRFRGTRRAQSSVGSKDESN